MRLRYCPECATKLTKVSDHYYTCQNKHPYYNNPKATADVVLMNDSGELLVSKRGREPFKGTYDLPGGFIEFGESAEQAAIREIKEETGLTLLPERLEIIFSAPGPYLENEWLVTTIYFAHHWDGTPVASDDSAALEWKPLSFIDSSQFGDSYAGLRETLERKLLK